MGKLIYKGLSKPSDEIPQPISVVLGSNLKPGSKPPSPPKPVRQPSPTQLEERARLVAEIKKHHPKAATEQIVRDLEASGE
jgi:hypothetical protein